MIDDNDEKIHWFVMWMFLINTLFTCTMCSVSKKEFLCFWVRFTVYKNEGKTDLKNWRELQKFSHSITPPVLCAFFVFNAQPLIPLNSLIKFKFSRFHLSIAKSYLSTHKKDLPKERYVRSTKWISRWEGFGSEIFDNLSAVSELWKVTKIRSSQRYSTHKRLLICYGIYVLLCVL